MSIDPYNPTQDQNPHSPMPAKPDPLGPGQVDLTPEHQPGSEHSPGNAERLPAQRERGEVERVIGGAEHGERGAPPSSR